MDQSNSDGEPKDHKPDGMKSTGRFGRPAGSNPASSSDSGKHASAPASSASKSRSGSADGSSKKRSGKDKARNGPQSKTKRRTKVQKPKGYPKRPLSAYNLFFKDERPRLSMEDSPADKAEDGVSSYQTLVRKIGARWKSLPPDTKKQYNDLAAQDLERYRSEVKEYESSMVEASRMERDRLHQKEAEQSSAALSMPSPSLGGDIVGSVPAPQAHPNAISNDVLERSLRYGREMKQLGNPELGGLDPEAIASSRLLGLTEIMNDQRLSQLHGGSSFLERAVSARLSHTSMPTEEEVQAATAAAVASNNTATIMSGQNQLLSTLLSAHPNSTSALLQRQHSAASEQGGLGLQIEQQRLQSTFPDNAAAALATYSSLLGGGNALGNILPHLVNLSSTSAAATNSAGGDTNANIIAQPSSQLPSAVPVHAMLHALPNTTNNASPKTSAADATATAVDGTPAIGTNALPRNTIEEQMQAAAAASSAAVAAAGGGSQQGQQDLPAQHRSAQDLLAESDQLLALAASIRARQQSGMGIAQHQAANIAGSHMPPITAIDMLSRHRQQQQQQHSLLSGFPQSLQQSMQQNAMLDQQRLQQQRQQALGNGLLQGTQASSMLQNLSDIERQQLLSNPELLDSVLLQEYLRGQQQQQQQQSTSSQNSQRAPGDP